MSVASIKTEPTTATIDSPLRIAVYLADQNPHRDRSLGITSMTQSMLRGFAKRDDLSVTQIVSRSSHRQDEASIQTQCFPFRTDHTLGRFIADSIHPWVARPNVDLWYYPKGYVPRIASPYSPSVGTMHDTIVQYYADRYPKSRTPAAFKYWIDSTKRSLTVFDHIFTVSESAASQLREFCDRHQITAPPMTVTYESSEWELLRQQPAHDKQDYVIHLSSKSPHKMTNHLLESWAKIQTQGPVPRLILVGQLDQEGHELLDKIPHSELLPPQERLELQTLVGQAEALLLPSEIEGFGLPALEAYYAGTPVCFVKETSVSEIIPEAGQFGGFELADVDSLFDALDSALNCSHEVVREISDQLYDRFAVQQTGDRMVQAFGKLVNRSSLEVDCSSVLLSESANVG